MASLSIFYLQLQINFDLQLHFFYYDILLLLNIFQQMFENRCFKEGYLLSILKLLNFNVYYISIVTFQGKNLIYIFYSQHKRHKNLVECSCNTE